MPSAKEKIIEELDTDTRHQNLLRFCAKAFAKTDLSEQSGYQFYFTEPLIELCEPQSGEKNFDLFLFNESVKSAIFIECKSSIPKRASYTIRGVEKAISLVQCNLDYLSDIIGIKLSKERIEYVLCIYDKDLGKVEDSFKAKAKSSNNNSDLAPNHIKLWVYKPHSEIIQLYINQSHNNLELSNMLLKGFDEKNSKSRFELPYICSSHKFLIIQNAIIGGCYRKNLRNQLQQDPKVIKIQDIVSILDNNLSLGMPREMKTDLLIEKVSHVIKYGEKYKLLEKINEEDIRLICQGNRIDLVLKNIKEKFLKNWIEEKSEEWAKTEALNRYKKRTGMRQLTDFKNHAERH